MTMTLRFLGGLVCWAGMGLAETVSLGYPVQLSIPFGGVQGTLLLFEDRLVFADTAKPEFSFGIERSNISESVVVEGVLSVVTSRAVRDRSGERSRFSFKLPATAEPGPLVAWTKGVAAPAAAPEAAASREGQEFVYDAKHTHFPFGACTGRVVFTAERFLFESVGNASHSRQWAMKDLKEVRRPNPYELEIKPFDGNDYKLNLLGKAMSSSDYQKLVEFVTNARMPR